MNILLKKATFDQQTLISNYFADCGNSSDVKLKIYSREGYVTFVNKNLIRINSSYINNILNDVPCCYSNEVILPDLSKKALDEVINIITQGVTCNSCNVKDTSDIIEGAKILGIDFSNLNYISVEYSESSHGCANIKKENPATNVKKETMNDDEDGEINDNNRVAIKEELSEKKETMDNNDDEINDIKDILIKEEQIEFEDTSPRDSSSPHAPTPPPTPDIPSTPHDMYNNDVIDSPESEDFFHDFEEGEIGSDESFDSKDMKVIRVKHEKQSTRQKFLNKSPMKYLQPWRSQRPELQYVYRNYFHPKCGNTHCRIDLCSAQPVHASCGRRHSYAMECNGNWMTLKKFENVARRWLDTRKEERKLQSLINSDKPEKDLEFEKMLDTCLDWNNGNCHKKCKKQHRCSKMVRDVGSKTRICWGEHKEVDHKYRK